MPPAVGLLGRRRVVVGVRQAVRHRRAPGLFVGLAAALRVLLPAGLADEEDLILAGCSVATIIGSRHANRECLHSRVELRIAECWQPTPTELKETGRVEGWFCTPK